MRKKEIITEQFRVMAADKKDPGTWYLKAVIDTRKAAEKYLNILRDVSDKYAGLRIEPVTVHQIISVHKKAKART